MLRHWSQFVPNYYVNPTSEDIKLHIIITRGSHRDCSGAVGVDYIIISYGHLFGVSHRAQELWESRWTSWGPRPFFFLFFFFVCGRKATLNERISVPYDKVQYVGLFGRREQRYSWFKQSLFAFMKIRTIKIIV